jgi:hypothetical protein
MENLYEKLLQESELERACSAAAPDSLDSENRTSSAASETKKRASRAEIWQSILVASRTIPYSLQHAFVVQVLVSILEDQEISIAKLNNALKKAFEAVRRVEEARKVRRAA